MRPRALYWMMLALLLAGCDGGERNAAVARKPDAPAAERPAPVVLFLGTSLTAGYGLAPEQAYPALIQEKIDAAGLPHRVINAGVSGETSAGALRRVDWLLHQPFDVLVLETGANDMLRGTDLDSTRANIQGIIDRVREARPEADVVLLGMMAPPNLGNRYTDQFRRIYPDLARRNDVALVPFLLEGVGGVAELNLADGIHPNAEGQRRLAETVWTVLEPELREAARK
ncbi:MAG TPA: arylesterase [Longimicrobiaceae bacterium]|nr:arylesterase [Longimicrobiaceae bacterium]